MKIRFANYSDKEQILNLILELENEGYKNKGLPIITLDFLKKEIFDHLLKDKNAKIFVAEEKNAIVGVITLYILHTLGKPQPRGHVEDLIVTKKMRGRGIGSKLMQCVLSYCNENNFYAIKLSSLLQNTEAHKFYEKHGGKFTEKMYRFNLK